MKSQLIEALSRMQIPGDSVGITLRELGHEEIRYLREYHNFAFYVQDMVQLAPHYKPETLNVMFRTPYVDWEEVARELSRYVISVHINPLLHKSMD